MSLEIPPQRTTNETEYKHFLFEGRKVAFRGNRNRAQSQERLTEVAAIESAVAAGQITLEGMSVTTDLL